LRRSPATSIDTRGQHIGLDQARVAQEGVVDKAHAPRPVKRDQAVLAEAKDRPELVVLLGELGLVGLQLAHVVLQHDHLLAHQHRSLVERLAQLGHLHRAWLSWQQRAFGIDHLAGEAPRRGQGAHGSSQEGAEQGHAHQHRHHGHHQGVAPDAQAVFGARTRVVLDAHPANEPPGQHRVPGFDVAFMGHQHRARAHTVQGGQLHAFGQAVILAHLRRSTRWPLDVGQHIAPAAQHQQRHGFAHLNRARGQLLEPVQAVGDDQVGAGHSHVARQVRGVALRRPLLQAGLLVNGVAPQQRQGQHQQGRHHRDQLQVQPAGPQALKQGGGHRGHVSQRPHSAYRSSLSRSSGA
jgi:hypothetical protein